MPVDNDREGDSHTEDEKEVDRQSGNQFNNNIVQFG